MKFGGLSFYRSINYCIVVNKPLIQYSLSHTGMSTVPEATVANHMGMKVFAMSLVTNMCIMDYESEEIANEAEVLEVGKMRSKDMTELIASMVKRIDIKDV